jgi:RNA-directed DNA polymerase
MVSGDRHHAEALREEVAAVLASLGLRLSPDKTRVVHIDEGFDFLGFTLRRQWNRGTRKYCVYTRPSKKAIQSVKDKVKVRTYRSTRNQDLDVVWFWPGLRDRLGPLVLSVVGDVSCS